MNKSFYKLLQFLLIFIAGIALFYLAFAKEDIRRLKADIFNANLFLIIISVIIIILSHLVRAVRWRMLIKPFGSSGRIFTVFNALMFGYLANIIVPRLGEISRCGYITRKKGLPMDKLIGTVIAERAVDILSLIVLLLLTLIFQSHVIGVFIRDHIFSGLKQNIYNNRVLLFFILIFFIAVFLLLKSLFRRNKNLIFKSKLYKKISRFLSGIVLGLKTIYIIKDKGRFIIYTVLLWILYLASTFFIFLSLEPTSHLGLGAALFVLTAGSLGMAAPVQGGIGAFHWIVSRGLLLYGIQQTDGLAYATLSHGTQTIVVIVLGSFSFLCIAFAKK